MNRPIFSRQWGVISVTRRKSGKFFRHDDLSPSPPPALKINGEQRGEGMGKHDIYNGPYANTHRDRSMPTSYSIRHTPKRYQNKKLRCMWYRAIYVVFCSGYYYTPAAPLIPPFMILSILWRACYRANWHAVPGFLAPPPNASDIQSSRTFVSTLLFVPTGGVNQSTVEYICQQRTEK